MLALTCLGEEELSEMGNGGASGHPVTLPPSPPRTYG